MGRQAAVQTNGWMSKLTDDWMEFGISYVYIECQSTMTMQSGRQSGRFA